MPSSTSSYPPLAQRDNEKRKDHRSNTCFKRKAMQTLSANRTIRQRPRQASRCKGSKVEQTSLRSAGTFADGFLRHIFLPKYTPCAKVPKQEFVEEVYLQSAKHLCEFYGVEAIDINDFSYPYNILLSDWHIGRQIRTRGRYREMRLEETSENQIHLSVRETINTGRTLYYIPLAPLYKHLHTNTNSCVKLLLGVCVYLHMKAGVCHYKYSESYICYLYDIMDSWIEDDKDSMDHEDYTEQRKILDEVALMGERMRSQLINEAYLLQLRSIANDFVATNRFEAGCLKLAEQTLALWAKYPHSNIYQHIVHEEDEDDYYNNGKIMVTEYISFIGETSSVVYDSMMTMVNDDFNERSGVQDFEATIVFDKEQGRYEDGLGYEEGVIAIISELCNLLDELS